MATLRWTVGSNCNKQLLRFFLREQCYISRRALADIKFNGGLILLNGNEVTVRAVVQEGDTVTISLPAEMVSESLSPENIPLHIIYEDEHLLVIHKEAGMPTIPSREHPTHTLANAVLGYYENKKIPATFHAVNRLDKDTSGLLLVAKHRLAHDRLSKLQQAGKVRRFYHAIVEGYLEKNVGTIQAPIGRDESSIIARKVSEDGQYAITHYSVKLTTGEITLVEIELETGRTHQIRVHFSHLGHPLLGDDLYGGKRDRICRQALHCSRIEFEHPFEKRKQEFKLELPHDMKSLIE
ncbi:RluA family pseudouridine synthase [bacterium LRH843]|nr:RluA family pseudouridine synthase [bacterium LRH843]